MYEEMTDTGTLPRPQAGRGGADEGAVGPRCWHSQGPYPPLSYMELSFHDHISATCPSAQKALVICVCVGGGKVELLWYHSSSHTSPQVDAGVCGKPSDRGGGLAEERGLARSDCRVPRLHKTGRRDHLSNCPTMASWALLLLTLELLATPGKDVTLSADPGSSPHPRQLSRCHHESFSLRARCSPSCQQPG